MSRLTSKLARLDADRRARTQAAAPLAEEAASGAALDALRARFGAVLGAPPQATTAREHESQDPLGASCLRLEATTVGEGVAWTRTVLAAGDESVGGTTLGRFDRADFELLSLLSLTPSLSDASADGALFLDTETTGLGGSGTVAFLVGLAWRRGGAWVIEQLFLRDHAAEPALLERVAERIAAARYLVSYNGKSFDLPLLKTRFVMNRLPEPPERPHVDLLHLVRRVHRGRRWKKSLKHAERHVLGFDRGHDVAGSDVAERYLHYLRCGDARGLEEVMTHNHHDVRSMVALMGIYGEALDTLEGIDLSDAARAAQRAGDLDRAAAIADRAVARGGGARGLEQRARIAKARGDKARALADFEALADQVDDGGVRLELAKLYEHFMKRPSEALEIVAAGTTEDAVAHAKRQARLRRKMERLEQRGEAP